MIVSDNLGFFVKTEFYELQSDLEVGFASISWLFTVLRLRGSGITGWFGHDAAVEGEQVSRRKSEQRYKLKLRVQILATLVRSHRRIRRRNSDLDLLRTSSRLLARAYVDRSRTILQNGSNYTNQLRSLASNLRNAYTNAVIFSVRKTDLTQVPQEFLGF